MAASQDVRIHFRGDASDAVRAAKALEGALKDVKGIANGAQKELKGATDGFKTNNAVSEAKKLEKSLKDVEQSSERTRKVMIGLGAGVKVAAAAMAAGFVAVAVGAKKAIDAASNLEESVNAVNRVFGTASKQIHAFAKTAATEVGLSMRAFNELVTPIGAALQNVGFSADQAAKSSIELTKRAADMASVFNVDVKDALAAIQAGLRGEADPLERFGVGLSAAAVNAKAMALGLADSEKALTAQDKATARLALVMEQTNRIQGDFKNTSDGLANAQRILRADIENAAAAIGSKLLPMAASAVGAFRDMIPRLQEVGSKIADTLGPAMEKAAERMANAMRDVGPKLTAVLPVFAEFGGRAAKGIVDAFAGIAEIVGRAVGRIADVIGEHEDEIRRIGERLAEVFSGAWEAVGDTLETLFVDILPPAIGLTIDALDKLTGVLDDVADAIGGWDDAFKLLAIGVITSKVLALVTAVKGLAAVQGIAALASAITGIGTAAAGAGAGAAAGGALGKVAALRAALLGLTKLSPIFIPITLLIYKKEVTGFLSALNESGPGLGKHLPKWMQDMIPAAGNDPLAGTPAGDAARAGAAVKTPQGTVADPRGGTISGTGAGSATVNPRRLPAGQGAPSIKPHVIAFVKRISGIYGSPLTITDNSTHNQFVAGTNDTVQSDHWTGNAADIPMAGAALTRLGQAALIAAGMSPAQAYKITGGVYNVGGVNILFNTNVGGNHYNHLHVGLKSAVAGSGDDTPKKTVADTDAKKTVADTDASGGGTAPAVKVTQAQIAEVQAPIRSAIASIADVAKDVPEVKKALLPALQGLMKDLANGVDSSEALNKIKAQAKLLREELARMVSVDDIRDGLKPAMTELKRLFAGGFISQEDMVKATNALRQLGPLIKKAMADGRIDKEEFKKISGLDKIADGIIEAGKVAEKAAQALVAQLRVQFRALMKDGILSDADLDVLASQAGKIEGVIGKSLQGAIKAVQDARSGFDKAWGDFRSSIEQAFKEQVIGKFQLTMDFASIEEQRQQVATALKNATDTWNTVLAGGIDEGAAKVQAAIERVLAANQAYTEAIISQDRGRIRDAIAERIAANAELAALAAASMSEQAKAVLDAGQSLVSARRAVGDEQIAVEKQIWEDSKTAALEGVLKVVDGVGERLRAGKITWSQAVTEIGAELRRAGMDAGGAAELLGQNMSGALNKAASAMESAAKALTAALNQILKAMGFAVKEAEGHYRQMAAWEKALNARSVAMNQAYAKQIAAARAAEAQLSAVQNTQVAASIAANPEASFAPTPGATDYSQTPGWGQGSGAYGGVGGGSIAMAEGGVIERPFVGFARLAERFKEVVIPLPPWMNSSLQDTLVDLAQGGWRSRATEIRPSNMLGSGGGGSMLNKIMAMFGLGGMSSGQLGRLPIINQPSGGGAAPAPIINNINVHVDAPMPNYVGELDDAARALARPIYKEIDKQISRANTSTWRN